MNKKQSLGWALKEFILGVTDMAWPHCCSICGRTLTETQMRICLDCMYELPSIAHHSFKDNRTIERLMGRIAFENAASGFRYEKDSKIQKAIELLKYKGEKEVGYQLAKMAAHKLHESGFFETVDYLIPVPLHRSRLKKRGYNQSEWIAKGLAEVSELEIRTDILKRIKYNPTQTTKNIWKRWENAQGLFELGNTTLCDEKHILLVDDVLTSGSTMEACCHVLNQIKGLKISIFSLALA